MIVKLGKEQQAVARRQLLSDIVWIVSNDTLRRLQKDGKTNLAPIEVYMSARQFSDVIMNLSDIDEGIDYEMDDLEDEADGENDAMLIAVLSALQMQALSKTRIGIDIKTAVMRILGRYGDHELLLPLISQWTKKEEARWLEGKKTNLLDYELQDIHLVGGGSEEIKNLFENFVVYSGTVDTETIRSNLLLLNRYNIDHGHAYDKEILALYDKLGIKSTTLMDVKEYVAVKQVETEIQHGNQVSSLSRQPCGVEEPWQVVRPCHLPEDSEEHEGPCPDDSGQRQCEEE